MTLTIKDGSTTPVNVVFNPIRRGEQKTFFQEDNATLVDAGRSLSVGIYRASGKGARHRGTLSFKSPIIQTDNGVSTVVDSDYVDVTFNFARVGSEDRRKSLIGLAANGVLEAAINAALTKLIPIN